MSQLAEQLLLALIEDALKKSGLTVTTEKQLNREALIVEQDGVKYRISAERVYQGRILELG